MAGTIRRSYSADPLDAVIADAGQRHRLVARGTDFTDPPALSVVEGASRRCTVSSNAVLAGAQILHLFYGCQFRGTQNGAVTPFEVTAARVMPQPGFRSRLVPSRCTGYTTYL